MILIDLYIEIEKNFPRIKKFFTEKTLLEFSHTPPGCLEKYNFGLGTMIRLKLLKPKSVLYKKFIQNGFTDKEKMTMEIIKAFYTSIQRRI